MPAFFASALTSTLASSSSWRISVGEVLGDLAHQLTDRGALDVGASGLGRRRPHAAAVVGGVVLLRRVGVADRGDALGRARPAWRRSRGNSSLSPPHRDGAPGRPSRPGSRAGRRCPRAAPCRRAAAGAGRSRRWSSPRRCPCRCWWSRRRSASGRRSSTAPGTRPCRCDELESLCAAVTPRVSRPATTPAAAAPSRNRPGLRRAKRRTSSSSSPGSRFCSLWAKSSTKPDAWWSRSRAGPGAPELVPSASPRSSWASEVRLWPAFCCWLMACSRTWLRPWSSRSLAWRWVSWATCLAWSVAVEATWLPAWTAVCWTFLASSLATSVVEGESVAVAARGAGTGYRWSESSVLLGRDGSGSGRRSWAAVHPARPCAVGVSGWAVRTRRPPHRSPASSGSAATPRYPVPGAVETETIYQSAQGNLGVRRSVKAATPSASSPAAIGLAVPAGDLGLAVASRGERRDDLLGGPLGQRRAAGQDVGEPVHLGLQVVGRRRAGRPARRAGRSARRSARR